MGARVNYVFDDGTDSLVVLYSHWGADSIGRDMQEAIMHAEPRKGDYSYWTRMVISYLIKDEVMNETGFGIFALSRSEIADLSTNSWGETVIIDVANAMWDVPFEVLVNA